MKTANSFPCTDSGNAELMAAMFKDDLRFDHKRGRWLLWKKDRWLEDRRIEIFSLAKKAARERLKCVSHISDDDRRTKQVGWALKSEDHYRLKAAVELVKGIVPIADSGDDWDSRPMLFGAANGVIDLRTGKLHTALREEQITLYSDSPFDPAARCPRFERFLGEIFQSDVELISFVKRAVGYSLTGDLSEQCMFCCFGHGANGKSTLLEILRTVFGPYAYSLPFSAFELKARASIPNDLAAIVGRRFVTSVETAGGVRLNEARIKALTGGDTISARQLYKEFFEFRPAAKLWLAFNHKPIVEDDSEGFWRRVRLIPFAASFSGAARDMKLLSKLESEASGILAWAVQGCIEWQREGLEKPVAVESATEAYRQESDPIREFLEQFYEADPAGCVSSSEIWRDYAEWSRQNGTDKISQQRFSERLKAHGLKPERLGHERTRAWRGLARKAGYPGADTRTRADGILQ